MITLKHAEVHWKLSSYCQFECSYCRFKSREFDHTIEEYLEIVEKLQNTRYQHHDRIRWKLGGGEPLHFPGLIHILKKIKEKNSIVELETSGDDNWFKLYSVINLLDKVILTYHSWQQETMFEFLLDLCTENNVNLEIHIPLESGLINETRQKVKDLSDKGYTCQEQKLTNEDGSDWSGYTQIDLNRIYNRPDEYNVVHDSTPAYVDLSKVNDTDPINTGKPCYAGIDWINISAKGWAMYSHCAGRANPFNVFDPNWEPPSTTFSCNVIQCKSSMDRKKIRVIDS